MRDHPFRPAHAISPNPISPNAAPCEADHASSAAREPDVQLAAMVPQSVKRAVRRRAEEEGTTVRSVLLRALKHAGIAEVEESEIADRRIAAGAERSGVWKANRTPTRAR
ncbi:hypothetical protein D9623_07715 [Azospirillum brasilense]|uniref:Ribbon-helix-helix protein CopG domain-containing protein n=1 Tax=Azospirillum brasilense TaxID=192 RepID=A0A0P0ESI3_AZOBR|nr:hypothetical protein [Azospirillum brasilense]PWC95527.1 hypothetical protein AEJ54_06275 [Azospirillum sp. Sp 7]ALJ35130.1 hypothetical protein AMK58_06660 [Azospirillum brasilense]MDW7629035.1 hypothetical protein [Azospirillum brasilense]MDX5953820.1 hypothetical protein [Azospirillum brasilense]OPH17064.1 hypothetical protein FE89_01925 [Azospirillum brasilense]